MLDYFKITLLCGTVAVAFDAFLMMVMKIMAVVIMMVKIISVIIISLVAFAAAAIMTHYSSMLCLPSK